MTAACHVVTDCHPSPHHFLLTATLKGTKWPNLDLTFLTLPQHNISHGQTMVAWMAAWTNNAQDLLDDTQAESSFSPYL